MRTRLLAQASPTLLLCSFDFRCQHCSARCKAPSIRTASGPVPTYTRRRLSPMSGLRKSHGFPRRKVGQSSPCLPVLSLKSGSQLRRLPTKLMVGSR
ncbi:hypothetical protein BJX70DRAFT_193523 [Aspergillus crustosus]